MKICLTGGIACGKSLLSRYLNEQGVETLDADDIVHELIPDANERHRLAVKVFADSGKRRELEEKLHPIVKERIEKFFGNGRIDASILRVAIVPLLFETHWERNFDIICCVVSERETQISRMMTTRGYTRAEAEARLAAQMPVAEKASKSHYVIRNDGTVAELSEEAKEFVHWLKQLKD